jgi:hypothetical protein
MTLRCMRVPSLIKAKMPQYPILRRVSSLSGDSGNLGEDLPAYPAASHLLALTDNTDVAFCVAPQVLAEFYASLERASGVWCVQH